ncbi:MAG: leucyl/phenylalanyl-tRNA--protein transferase [Flavobacteriaceae bacterium]|nr:MAG: leucyl/phenylalanyl-tRNA--protein transferase [Flavobacteriaceae bacterium]
MVLLNPNKLEFPDPSLSNSDGILALGGDLKVERLKLAYKSGIFPWYNPGEIIAWFSPENRMVLNPSDLKLDKDTKRLISQNKYKVTQDLCFKEVVLACKNAKRKDGHGTWIGSEIIEAYLELHRHQWAHSFEVWNQKQELVGGLYGVEVGSIFCGESMFSIEKNTSKIALWHLCNQNLYTLIDCQVYNPHLERIGAKEIPREKFLSLLKNTNISV